MHVGALSLLCPAAAHPNTDGHPPFKSMATEALDCECSCINQHCCDNSPADLRRMCGSVSHSDPSHGGSALTLALVVVSAVAVLAAVGVATWLGSARARRWLSLPSAGYRQTRAREGCAATSLGPPVGVHDA